MNESNLALLKNKIDEEIIKTEATVTEYKELTKPIAPENAIGRVSRMDAINNKSVTEAALRTAENKLKLLYQMKDNWHKPDFGDCAKCRQEIPIMRLLLVPQSRFCVRCAQ
jgi:DnaK suppressor protein